MLDRPKRTLKRPKRVSDEVPNAGVVSESTGTGPSTARSSKSHKPPSRKNAASPKAPARKDKNVSRGKHANEGRASRGKRKQVRSSHDEPAPQSEPNAEAAGNAAPVNPSKNHSTGTGRKRRRLDPPEPAESTQSIAQHNGEAASQVTPNDSGKRGKKRPRPAQGTAEDGGIEQNAENNIGNPTGAQRKRQRTEKSTSNQNAARQALDQNDTGVSGPNQTDNESTMNAESDPNGGWDRISAKKPRQKPKRARSKKTQPASEGPTNAADTTSGDAANSEAHKNGTTAADTEQNLDAETQKANGTRRKRRQSAPDEDDEDHMIDPQATVMWDLTRDSRKGKVSNLERAFRQINWKEVKKRKEEEALRALEAPDDEDNEGGDGDHADELTARLEAADATAQATSGAVNNAAPEIKIVNGQLVFGDAAQPDAAPDPQATAEAQALAAETDANNDNTINGYAESDLTNHITTVSWLGANKRHKLERHVAGRGGNRWTDVETDKFYEAIRIFGADFTIIQKMFPERTRRQIKLKFVREEKGHPAKMRSVMVGPTSEKAPMSLEKYVEMTGMDPGPLSRESTRDVQGGADGADGDAMGNGEVRASLDPIGIGRLFKDPRILDNELAMERERQMLELQEEQQALEESVKLKRERARERQKEKEKARREKNKKSKGKGGDTGGTGGDADAGAEGVNGGEGREIADTVEAEDGIPHDDELGEAVDLGSDAGYDQFGDDDYDGGHAEPSIEA
ncbi:MAG: hypothetical protein Q9162_007152 [Coniocarpon cinnabarinum]